MQTQTQNFKARAVINCCKSSSGYYDRKFNTLPYLRLLIISIQMQAQIKNVTLFEIVKSSYCQKHYCPPLENRNRPNPQFDWIKFNCVILSQTLVEPVSNRYLIITNSYCIIVGSPVRLFAPKQLSAKINVFATVLSRRSYLLEWSVVIKIRAISKYCFCENFQSSYRRTDNTILGRYPNPISDLKNLNISRSS